MRAGEAELAEQARLLGDVVPLIDFHPEHADGVDIGKLRVLKTTTRTLRTVQYGSFAARAVHLHEPERERQEGGSRKYISRELLALVHGKKRFTMDVMCAIGRLRYLENKSRDDTVEEMMRRHVVNVSTGTVTNYALEFLVRFELYHHRHFDRLVKAMRKDGGYVLGLDGTGDGASDRILLLMDLLTGWALSSGGIPSERENYITPHLEDLKVRAGTPLGIVRDMGPGLRKACERVFPGRPTRECNFHFLRDAGEDMMKDTHLKLKKAMVNLKVRSELDKLRKELNHEAASRGVNLRDTMDALKKGEPAKDVEAVVLAETYHLISWTLNYREEAHGLRFPYTLPWMDLYRRCRRALEPSPLIARTAELAGVRTGYIESVRRIVRRPFHDRGAERLDGIGRRLEEAHALFTELRGILRIPEDKGDIPRDQLLLSYEDASKMERELAAFRDRLEKARKKRTITPEGEVILYHIKKHWDGLAVPNITVTVDGKPRTVAVPRAISQADSRFGVVKTGIRKRTGRKDTGHELNMYGALLCLVQNLHSDQYVKVMFGSIEQMPEALGRIPKEDVDRKLSELKDARCRYDITRARGKGEFEKLVNICKRVLDEVELNSFRRKLLNPIWTCQKAQVPTDS